MNHAARAPYGSATLASHIPTPETRARDRDTIAGAMAVCNTAGSLLKEHGDKIAALEAENAALRDALESLSYVHDTNPSDAWADAPPEAYARHMLYEVRCLARAAIAAKEQAK